MNLSGFYALVLGQIPCGVANVTADLASKAVFSTKYVVDLQAQYHGIHALFNHCQKRSKTWALVN